MSASPIITFTTDWGERDFFVGMAKGKLYSLLPEARIVDITHEIPHYELYYSLFVVKNACLAFPPGTIHIVDVRSEAPFIVVCYKGHFFVCSDNGLPYSAFGDAFSAAVRLRVDTSNDPCVNAFPGYHVLCEAAAKIASGVPLTQMGDTLTSLAQAQHIGIVERTPNVIDAYVCYIDSYGNADLSITFSQFEELRRGRRFEARVKEHVLQKLSVSYRDVQLTASNHLGLLLTVSSSGNMQVALSFRSAEQLMGMRMLEKVTFTFFD